MSKSQIPLAYAEGPTGRGRGFLPIAAPLFVLTTLIGPLVQEGARVAMPSGARSSARTIEVSTPILDTIVRTVRTDTGEWLEHVLQFAAPAFGTENRVADLAVLIVMAIAIRTLL